MNIVDQLTEYYKRLNGIDPGDTSQDDLFKLMFGSALEVAKKKACNWDEWDDINKLPPPILLGLMEMIKLTLQRGDIMAGGVKSESIGGMSQTFFDADFLSSDNFFKQPFDLFGLYCKPKNALVFKKAKRSRC